VRGEKEVCYCATKRNGNGREGGDTEVGTRRWDGGGEQTAASESRGATARTCRHLGGSDSAPEEHLPRVEAP
jgi:hypothetical protein